MDIIIKEYKEAKAKLSILAKEDEKQKTILEKKRNKVKNIFYKKQQIINNNKYIALEEINTTEKQLDKNIQDETDNISPFIRKYKKILNFMNIIKKEKTDLSFRIYYSKRNRFRDNQEYDYPSLCTIF